MIKRCGLVPKRSEDTKPPPSFFFRGESPCRGQTGVSRRGKSKGRDPQRSEGLSGDRGEAILPLKRLQHALITFSVGEGWVSPFGDTLPCFGGGASEGGNPKGETKAGEGRHGLCPSARHEGQCEAQRSTGRGDKKIGLRAQASPSPALSLSASLTTGLPKRRRPTAFKERRTQAE